MPIRATTGRAWLRSGLPFCLLFLFGCSSQLLAQNDFFSSIDIDIEEPADEGPLEFLGWVSQKLSYGLEAPGPLFNRSEREINKIETSLFAQLDLELGEQTAFRLSGKAYHDEVYRWFDETAYGSDEINEFRNRFEFRDFYLESQFDNGLYVKVGNQMLAWGMAEYLRVTDLVNREDQYTLGQQDLQDQRLQVPALLLSFGVGDWNFDSAVTVAAKANRLAPVGDEFDPFIALRQAGATVFREEAGQALEFFLRASTRLAQGDLQVVAGEFNDKVFSLRHIDNGDSPSPLLNFSPNRMRALGVAANWVEGSWLWFGELGLHRGKAQRPRPELLLQQAAGWQEKDQLLGVIGAEYNGFENLLLTLELDAIHTHGHEQNLQARQDQLGGGVRLYWTALNERLQVLGVWNELLNSAGRVIRVSADYNWSDNLDIGLLWVDYGTAPDSPFGVYRFNDVLQLQLRYSFQL